MNNNKKKTKPSRSNTNIKTTVIGRLGIIIFIFILLALAIVYKLVDTTIIHADDWQKKGESTLDTTALIPPMRGDILASNGNVLATNLNYHTLRIDFRTSNFKVKIYRDSLEKLADSLSRCLTYRSKKEWVEYLKKPLEEPRDKRPRGYIIAKNIPEETVNRIKKFPFFNINNSRKTGLINETVLKRSYPYGDMARLSIGRVGQTKDDPEVHGISGLERALDSLLYGTPGIKKKGISIRGERFKEVVPPTPGYTVTTTIDITMQDILEYELGEMLVKAKADWGTAMIMEVATGDIKAISNLERDTVSKNGKYIEAMNRAVLAYEPGSVMKVMTMAVDLEKGYALPVSKTFGIGRSYHYAGGKPINDTHSPATLPVSRFIEYSSNIGMVKLTMPHFEDNPNRFKECLAEMGFFDRFNTGIARERIPYFPKLKNNKGGRINLSRMVFGYSTMIPPLYICGFYNAVANDGRFVRPRLVKGLRLPDGHDSIIEVSYIRDRILSSQNAKILQKMMHDVVWEQGGTAKVLKSDIVEIAGKTGTCKLAREAPPAKKDSTGKPLPRKPFVGGYIDGHYRVTFCGFFPYKEPKYTCIVVISDPKMPYRGASVSSGMVLKNVAHKLFARGYLTEDPSFEREGLSETDKATTPVIYSSFNDRRSSILHKDLNFSSSRKIAHPTRNNEAQTIPDVKGVGIREALAKLESAGFAVSFTGIGYVESQDPPAGTKASPGTKVKLRLRHLE